MKISRSRTWLSLPGLALVLLVVVLLGAGCVAAAPATVSPTKAPDQAPTQAAPAATVSAAAAPATEAPATSQPAAKAVELPAGVDATGHFYQGDPNAKVKLIEYSDFQCPYCARHATQTAPLLDASYVASGKVLHIFRQFPLQIHPNALPAAKAAVCAGQQKPAYFWMMHDWLFANQEKWGAAQNAADQFRQQALAIGADGSKFDTCVAAPETMAAIQSDLDEGAKDGIQGTPAFFVNDWFVNGAQPIEEFQKTIDKALQGAHPAPTATPLPEGVLPYDANPARPGFTYDGSPSLGSASAPLVMIEFADFQCSYCAQYSQTTEPGLRKKWVETGQLRTVFKFYPTYAPKAAVAAACASDQGKFWEFHDALFAQQKDWKDGDDEAMVKYAKGLGLDEAKFRQCLKDAPGQTLIDADAELGQQVGLQGTPFFFILNPKLNAGMKIPGAATLDQFDGALKDVLNPPPTATAGAPASATPASATPAPATPTPAK